MKTDVQDQLVARQIIYFLQQTFSHCRINFDLDDCDRVLRIESLQGSAIALMALSINFCSLLSRLIICELVFPKKLFFIQLNKKLTGFIQSLSPYINRIFIFEISCYNCGGMHNFSTYKI